MDNGGAHMKGALLFLIALSALIAIANVIDVLGFKSTPWYGWWESTYHRSGPYSVQYDSTQPGGAAARAGIRPGDRFDLREQSLDTRLWLLFQPVTTKPVALVMHRGSRTYATNLFPGTIWDGDSGLKLWNIIAGVILTIPYLACAFLITVRRTALPEARRLALILILGTLAAAGIVVPSAVGTTMLTAVSVLLTTVQLVIVVDLSSRFGERSRWRSVLDICAYGLVLANLSVFAAFLFGMVALSFDPLPFASSGSLAGPLGEIAWIGAVTVLLVAAGAAVATCSPSERPRVAWLLLPVPASFFAAGILSVLTDYANSWYALEALLIAERITLLLGAVAVTYALLKRRVLDFEFVLSRTLIVTIVSLIVVAAFVLLEWLLGSVLAGVSHATSLAANAALALVLGLSLRYIHMRVDVIIDAVLFRKRHEDERAARFLKGSCLRYRRGRVAGRNAGKDSPPHGCAGRRAVRRCQRVVRCRSCVWGKLRWSSERK